MNKGILVAVVMAALAFSGSAFAGWIPESQEQVQAPLNTGKIESILPPGADVADSRGSLVVEKLPITERVLADGSMTRTLPVRYTFVNQWHETFMFDGFNEAVLTDAVGEKHYASSVYRNEQPLLSGVSGLIPPGGTTVFTLFYDLGSNTTVAMMNDTQLDLRYLNHGHPYLLSALIASEPGVEERPEVVEVRPPAPAPVPEPIAPAPVVVKEVPPAPVVVPRPEPQPIPVVQAPPPPPAPAPYVPPIQEMAPPPVMAPPPMVAQAPPPMAPAPQQVVPFQCNPCPPCQPCFNPCDLLKLPCCILNQVLKGVCCITCVTTKGICEITCGTVSCLSGALCCNTCGTAPCCPPMGNGYQTAMAY